MYRACVAVFFAAVVTVASRAAAQPEDEADPDPGQGAAPEELVEPEAPPAGEPEGTTDVPGEGEVEPPAGGAEVAEPAPEPPGEGAEVPAEQAPTEIEEFSLEELLGGGFREAAAAPRGSELALPGALSTVRRELFESQWGAINVADALRIVPGVAVQIITASQYLIGVRGSNPFDSQRIAYLIDGVPNAMDFFGVRTYTQIPLAGVDIERIEILRNPSVLYGPNAVAGVINVHSRPPTRNAFNLQLSGGENYFHWGSASATGVLERGAFRVGFDYQRTNQWGDRDGLVDNGPMLTAASESDAARDRIMIDEHYNAGGQVWHQEGEHQLQLVVGYSSFAGRLRFPDRICEQEVSLRGPVVSLTHAVALEPEPASESGEGSELDRPTPLTLQSRLTFAQIDSDLVGARRLAGMIENGSPHSLVRREASLSVQLSGSLLREIGGHLLVGGDLWFLNTSNTRFLTANYNQLYGGIFLLPSIGILPGLRLYFGGRLDVAFSEDFLPSPTGSLVYAFERVHSLRLTASSAARSPNLYERGLSFPFVEDSSVGKRGYYFGNPDVQAERLSQIELAYRLDLDFLQVEAAVFASTLHGQIELVEITPERLAERGLEAQVMPLLGTSYDPTLPYLEYHNQATVDTLGAELGAVVRPIAGLTVSGSYTLLASQASVTSDASDVMRRETAAAQNAPPHRFALGASYVLQELLPGSGLAVTFEWSDETAAFVSGRLSTIPPWFVLSARVMVGLPNDLGHVSVDFFNILDEQGFGSPHHFEWPRHQVGRRILGTLRLNI